MKKWAFEHHIFSYGGTGSHLYTLQISHIDNDKLAKLQNLVQATVYETVL